MLLYSKNWSISKAGYNTPWHFPKMLSSLLAMCLCYFQPLEKCVSDELFGAKAGELFAKYLFLHTNCDCKHYAGELVGKVFEQMHLLLDTVLEMCMSMIHNWEVYTWGNIGSILQ